MISEIIGLLRQGKTVKEIRQVLKAPMALIQQVKRNNKYLKPEKPYLLTLCVVCGAKKESKLFCGLHHYRYTKSKKYRNHDKF